MKVKAVLLALAVAAIAAAGAAAQGGLPPSQPPGGTTGAGGPGGPGGSGGGRPGRPGWPPGQNQQPNPNGQGQGQGDNEGQGQGGSGQGGTGPGNRTGDGLFRQQLLAAGYRCLFRPAILHGSLTAIGSDSITVHAMLGRTGAGADVNVKVLQATLFFRMGPAKLSDLVVGDNVLVFAAVCRSAPSTTGQTGTTGATGATGATGSTGTVRTPPTLVARRVGARPATTAHG